MPRTDVLPTVKGAALTVAAFSGERPGRRQRSAQGNAEVGRSRVEGSLSFSAGAGLTLKAKVDEVDAQVSGVKLQRAGRTIDVERARLMGRSGSIDFSPSRVLVDAKQLAWDVIVREASLRTGHLSARGNQVHGEGHFDYDSRRDLRLEGALHVDGGVSARPPCPPARRRSTRWAAWWCVESKRGLDKGGLPERTWKAVQVETRCDAVAPKGNETGTSRSA